MTVAPPPQRPPDDAPPRGTTRGPASRDTPAGLVGPPIVCWIVALLASSASVVVATAPSDVGARPGEAFQSLVGGLGGGPATSLSPCARTFDPRLDDGCVFRVAPVPCGDPFCAHGAGGLPTGHDADPSARTRLDRSR